MVSITTVPAGFKICSKCSEPQPISRFYKNRTTKDGLAQYCKTHQREAVVKAEAKAKTEKRERGITLNRSTMLGRHILALRGIPTFPGIAAGLKFVDLVAWGCVPVEIKTAIADKRNKCSWGITASQRERGFEGVMVFIGFQGNRQRVFIVPADNEWLQAAVARGRVIVTLDSWDKRGVWGELKRFEDNYGAIQELRTDYSEMIMMRAALDAPKLHEPQEKRVKTVAELPLFRDLPKAA